VKGSDEDGNSLEVDNWQGQLAAIFDGSKEAKRLEKVLQENFGDEWVFPGDPDFAWVGLLLPKDCQTLVSKPWRVFDFPVDLNRIEEYLEYVYSVALRFWSLTTFRDFCTFQAASKTEGLLWLEVAITSR
jgi:hypothetical protein